MRRFIAFVVVLCAVVILGALLPHWRQDRRVHAGTQSRGNWTTGNCPDSDRNSWGHWGAVHECQLRRATLTLNGNPLSVSSTNGSIHVIGQDRSDVELEASVNVWASSNREADRLLRSIQVHTANGDIYDRGPHFFFFSGYSVNYRLLVPRGITGHFSNTNGGIALDHLNGKVRFGNTNGGVTLRSMNGDVQGHSVNGGIQITLAGDTWQGAGLRADTTNGGIDLRVPDQYSAHVDAGTVNGGISASFPVNVQGNVRNHLDANLGNGGPTIHLQTVNGGISIAHPGPGSGKAD